MLNEILFTSVFNDSVFTKIKVGYQYQSVLTQAVGLDHQKFISQTRGINSNLHNLAVSEVSASDIPSALINHIALVNAALDNKAQPLATQPLAAFDISLALAELSASTHASSANSFNTPLTQNILAASIGYDVPQKMSWQRRPLLSLVLAAGFGLLAYNYATIF